MLRLFFPTKPTQAQFDALKAENALLQSRIDQQRALIEELSRKRGMPDRDWRGRFVCER